MVHLAHCWEMKQLEPLLSKNSVNWKKKKKKNPNQNKPKQNLSRSSCCGPTKIQLCAIFRRLSSQHGSQSEVEAAEQWGVKKGSGCCRLKGQGESQNQLSACVSAEFHAHMSGALLWCQHKPCCVASLPCAILCLNCLQCVGLLCKRQQTLLFCCYSIKTLSAFFFFSCDNKLSSVTANCGNSLVFCFLFFYLVGSLTEVTAMGLTL